MGVDHKKDPIMSSSLEFSALPSILWRGNGLEVEIIIDHAGEMKLPQNPNKFGGFPGGSENKESACNVGDPGLIPGLGRSPGEGNGYPLQYSCLENSMDREDWQAIARGVTKSWTQLSN